MEGSSPKYAKAVLPLKRSSVAYLLSRETRKETHDALKAFNRPEILSLLILSKVRMLVDKPDQAATLMQAQLNEMLEQTKSLDMFRAVRGHIENTFNPEALSESLELLPNLGVDLQHESEWDAPNPTQSNGSVNPEFSIELVNRRLGKVPRNSSSFVRATELNDRQYRIYSVVRSDPEEHLHVQGYGGGGKTHLIRQIYRDLPSEHAAVLAQTKAQLYALTKGLDRQVNKFTFAKLAWAHLIAAGVPRSIISRDRSESDYNVTDLEIARNMGFTQLGAMSPEEVAKNVVRGVLYKFCESSSLRVTEEHLTKKHRSLRFDDQIRLIDYTQRYWDELISEGTSKWQPLRTYHLIKLASTFPSNKPIKVHTGEGREQRAIDLKFAIVDEAHDLTPSLTQLLYSSGVSICSLGDSFQRIGGQPPAIPTNIRKKEIELSMRAGPEMDTVVNPILGIHPRFQRMKPFEGVRDISTKIHFYDVRKIPSSAYTILCGSHFSIFEYLHEMVNSHSTLALLPATHSDFINFSDSLFRLRNGKRGRHPLLFKYSNWEELASAFGKWFVFQKIERMFERGYTEEDFQNVASRIGELGKTDYLLGLVDHSKNWQFPNVMLSPELFSPQRDDTFISDNLSRVYLAMTRAQRNLAIPKGYENFIESIKDLIAEKKKWQV